MVSPTRLPRTTLAEGAAEALRQMIRSGELPLGSALRQEELAARLGISRTPLREAISRLDAEGLIVNDPHRGAVVYRPAIEDLVEACEILEELEALAARLAARHWREGDLEPLKGILDGFAGIEDAAAWREQNERFHACLYSMAYRPQLLELVMSRFKRATVFIHIMTQDRDYTRSNQEHQLIFGALKRRDEITIDRLLRAHVRAVLEHVAKHLP